MANTFKVKTSDNSSKNADTFATIYTVPSATTTIVLGLTIANLLSQSIEGTVFLENADGDNVTYLNDIPLPSGSAVEVMAGNKIVLETGDILKVQSNTANSLDTTMSIMEQT